MAKKRAKDDPFKDLSWADIEEWAGDTIMTRGKGYQRSGRVQDLALTPGGELVAWVEGSGRYATLVELSDGELASDCTCPYNGICKHAVAVALEYLDHVKNNIPVPRVTHEDKRIRLLEELGEGEDWDDEEDEGWDGEAEADNEEGEDRGASELGAFLEQQTKAQLIALLKDLAAGYPVVRKALEDREDLSKGASKKMVQAVRKEVRALSAEPGWTEHWNDDGFIPDYSGVKRRMETLLAGGYADEVLSLGEELLEAGTEQVEMSDDEGETGEEIASCLEVVFRALPQSSLAPSEQMLWVVKTELEDEYDLCYGAESFWEQTHAASDWDALAEQLLNLLHNFPSAAADGASSADYRRDELSDWVIHALENAGRHDEIIPLCEGEAEKTRSYVRLVNRLRDAKRHQEAEKWIHEGIEATQKEWPGIADSLREAWREMREESGDWLSVAALRADAFVARPSLLTFQELQKAAEQAQIWPAVREAAMDYLENGKLPGTTPAWPLPKTGIGEVIDLRARSFPMTEVLLNIAIAEKRPDEVIRWYERRKDERPAFGWGESQDDRVAGALAERYPERALAMWKQLAERQIALTKPQAYDVAAGYLRKMHRVFKDLGKEIDWQNYVADLRRANARKSRFIQTLNDLRG